MSAIFCLLRESLHVKWWIPPTRAWDKRENLTLSSSTRYYCHYPSQLSLNVFATCLSTNITCSDSYTHTHVIKINKYPISTDFRPKKHPYLKKKNAHFFQWKHPFFYQNTDIGWTGTRILTFEVIILCLFSGSTASRLTEAQSLRESLGVRAEYISWIVRGFSPP